ncbi:MAG TPA: DUF4403 family protein [Polyangiaceae bacterium]|nr:DUF4403 family protein [Polyangiaceae bacterium]
MAIALGAAGACSRFGPVYPPRPAPSLGAPIADPPPARVVTHMAVAAAALKSALEDAAPGYGDGTFTLLGSERRYTWVRGPLDVSFGQGRVVIATRALAKVALPIKSISVPLDVRIEAEPVVNADYAVRLQGIDVHVTSDAASVSLADRVAGIYDRVAEPLAAGLKSFAFDLRPVLWEAYARISKPISLPLYSGRAGWDDGSPEPDGGTACARLRLLDVEAGPTVFADGIEKDVALVVAPSITLPCAEDASGGADGLPPLSNVAAVTPGPFSVTIPVAASYRELTRVMSANAFTDGKLFFSTEYPSIYLERPELYESGGALVLKLSIRGHANKMGIDAELDGDLYLVGHPVVTDNELRVPDLEPTIETRNFLLSLKAMTDGDRIRDEARQALRLDIGERLREARDKWGGDLTFGFDRGCFQGNVDRVEVTGVYPHAAYLRVYVTVTARSRLTMPCPAAN